LPFHPGVLALSCFFGRIFNNGKLLAPRSTYNYKGKIVMSMECKEGASSSKNQLSSTLDNSLHDATTPTPFEESYPSEQLRLFWDAKPFSVVEALMGKIMSMDPAHPEKLLEIRTATSSPADHQHDEDTEEQTGSSLMNNNNTDTQKPHDNVFQNFYQGRLMDENDDRTDGDDECDDDERQGNKSSSSLRKERSGKHNFRLDLAYKGSDFCGWQRQQGKKSVGKSMSMANADATPTTTIHDNATDDAKSIIQTRLLLPSVQEVVEAALDDRDVRVAGRTDAGVHAFGQVARVRLETHISLQQVQQKLTAASSPLSFASSWKCWRVVAVDTKFHPSFGAASRSYAYVLDGHVVQWFFCSSSNNNNDLQQVAQALNEMLHPLQGQALDYFAFSYGKIKTQSSICTLHHAHVSIAQITGVQNDTHDDSSTSKNARGSTSRNAAIIVELTGDRFLRRMVRKLVATALHLLLPIQQPYSLEHETKSTSCSDDVPNNDTDSITETRRGIKAGADALLKIVQSKDRRESAKAAPPNGLILVGAEMKKNH
jgi:tRNA pseudouridine(38-40) synthase